MRQFSLFLKGTMILTLAGLLTRTFGFFYKIFLAQTLGAEGMGLYQLIFPVFSVCHALSCSGVETAVSRFTACSEEKRGGDYLYAGLLLTLTASCAVSLVLWTRADFIALTLMRESRCAPLLRVLALALPFSAVHCCFAGFFLGKKKAGLPAAAQLIEQIIRIGAVWLLCGIAAQNGMAITPVLAVAGLLAGEIGSSLFMLTAASGVHFRLTRLQNYLSGCRALLSMALPLTGTRLSLTLLQSAEAVLIPLCLKQSGLSSAEALSLYGILTGMALPLLMFPSFFSSSLSAMLLPTISEEQARGNRAKISLAIEYTISFGLTIGFLCMGVFLVFGEDIGTLIFGEQLAGRFLRTLAWICPVLYLTGNLNSILHGLGRTPVTFFNQLAAILIRILCVLTLVPLSGIEAVLWGLLLGQAVLCFLGVRAVAPHISPSIGLETYILRPLAALLLSTGGVYILKRPLSLLFAGMELLQLLAGVCVMAVAYLALLFLFGGWKLLRRRQNPT
ncbi:MAG: oligosaccharide flippase family protein [Lachnospiraceae bacterium]|nr:oligosaccharide flippase family protein [Lachnospiraceae bacterium]